MSATGRLEAVVAEATKQVKKSLAEYGERNKSKDAEGKVVKPSAPRGFVEKALRSAVRPEALFDALLDDLS